VFRRHSGTSCPGTKAYIAKLYSTVDETVDQGVTGAIPWKTLFRPGTISPTNEALIVEDLYMPTQTRISNDVHALLSRLAGQTGKTHQEVIDVALRRYEREIFLDAVNESFTALRADEDAWKDELRERAEWEATLSDRDE